MTCIKFILVNTCKINKSNQQVQTKLSILPKEISILRKFNWSSIYIYIYI